MLHDVFHPGGGGVLPARFQAIEMAAALREIEREVSRRLEDAQLPGALARHAARGDDRDGAIGELDAGVRDVDVRREDRHAGCPHFADLRSHQLQHQIEIVNHQVQDHRDVGAARLERGETFGLQKPGLVEIGGGGAHRPVESLHVTHLETAPALARRVHQLLGARQRVRQRLLDQRVEAALQHHLPDANVGRRRHDHGDRLDAVE